MNRRKKTIRYKRLFESQWYRFYKQPEVKDCIVHSARMLIAARKRVAPWRVVPERYVKDNSITGFKIL